MKTPKTDAEVLKPCVLCALGKTVITENHHSPTMSGGIKEPISVDIRHWCEGEGLPHRRINITGRTRNEAIECWNTRHIESSQAQGDDPTTADYLNGKASWVSEKMVQTAQKPAPLDGDVADAIKKFDEYTSSRPDWKFDPCFYVLRDIAEKYSAATENAQAETAVREVTPA